jgi:hypothetical protein
MAFEKDLGQSRRLASVDQIEARNARVDRLGNAGDGDP